MGEALKIDKTEVLPGETAIAQIKVSRLPSGTRINIYAHGMSLLEPNGFDLFCQARMIESFPCHGRPPSQVGKAMR